MEDYLKAFDPEATIEKYADQLGADVNPPIAGSKSKPVPGYVYAKSVRYLPDIAEQDFQLGFRL
jgi:hypothetical protein